MVLKCGGTLVVVVVVVALLPLLLLLCALANDDVAVALTGSWMYNVFTMSREKTFLAESTSTPSIFQNRMVLSLEQVTNVLAGNADVGEIRRRGDCARALSSRRR